MRKILLLLTLLISGIGVSQTTLTLGSGTSTSNQRGPLSRSSSSSSQTLSRVQLLYLASELSSISANSTISQVNFDLGSTNVLTATGNATLKIYMKNSSLANVVDNTLWTTVSTGSTLVGTYTFNLANNFPGAEGFMNFVLDTGFVYTGGSLEISTEWDSSTLTVADAGQPNLYFTGDGSLKWHYTNTTHGSSIDRTGSSSQPSTLTVVNTSKVNTQLVHANSDPSAIDIHSIGTGTSSSATRGPVQRGDVGSTALFSRNNLVYTSAELLTDLTSNALISKIDFDLGSTNIITASGNATLDIYMKNSAISEAPASETWTNIISGATLVGTYTFNTTNNFPGSEGFLTFNLDKDFEYTGGTLEVSVDWNSSGLTVADAAQPNLYFSGNGSLNWHWSATAHNSLVNRSGSSSAPSTLNSQKSERVNTKFTFKKMTTSSWVGTTADWGTGSNWSSGFAPSEAVTVTIGSTGNDPLISSSTGAKTHDLTLTSAGLTIEAGGSLIVKGTSVGNITHKRTITKDVDPTEAWFSVSSPVNGTTVTTLQAENNFAPGTAGSRIGLATYKNDGTIWNYFTTGSTDAITSGTGLTAKLDNATAGADLSFTGTYTSGNVEPSISQSTNNFNFVGNPYTAYVNLGTFFADNNVTNRLSEQTIWIWDENKNGANMGGYVQKMSGTDAAFEIAPGQGFFVSAGTAASNKVTFTETNQSHQTESFLRSSNTRTEINLSVAEEGVQKKTQLYYIAGTSTDLDKGFDGTMFTGIGYNLAIYTELVTNNQGRKLGVQSLPNSDYENMIVPIGVKATANKEITLSANALNLPDGIKVFIEDKEKNVFTNLNEGDYKVTLTDALDGIGRFYLHTTESALSIDKNVTLNNISIFKTNSTTLRIVGLQQGNTSVKLFNVLGKQVLNSSFETNGVKDISLPKLAKGIYIVQLTSENGKLNKKIILE